MEQFEKQPWTVSLTSLNIRNRRKLIIKHSIEVGSSIGSQFSAVNVSSSYSIRTQFGLYFNVHLNDVEMESKLRRNFINCPVFIAAAISGFKLRDFGSNSYEKCRLNLESLSFLHNHRIARSLKRVEPSRCNYCANRWWNSFRREMKLSSLKS